MKKKDFQKESFVPLMEERAEMLKELIAELEEKLGNESYDYNIHVRTRKNGNEPQFYRCEKGDCCGKYVKKKDIAIVAAFSQNEYYQKVLFEARHELNNIKRYLANAYSGMDPLIKAYLDMHPAKRGFISPLLPDDEYYVSTWQNESFTCKGFSDDSAEHFSNNGMRVRSKSEGIIANALDKMNIPYKYEKQIVLGGISFFPDFSALNVRQRREIVWEHFGMLEDGLYINNAIRKLGVYEKNGFILGKNLILTYETQRDPFNSRKAEKVIKEYLL